MCQGGTPPGSCSLPTWPVEYLKEKSACRWSSFSCDTASTVSCWLAQSTDGKTLSPNAHFVFALPGST